MSKVYNPWEMIEEMKKAVTYIVEGIPKVYFFPTITNVLTITRENDLPITIDAYLGFEEDYTMIVKRKS